MDVAIWCTVLYADLKQILLALKCISCCAFQRLCIQGGKNSASCAISLAEESLGPCLTINNHLLQRSSLQSNLCLSTAFYISLSRCLYRDVNLQCLFWLYLPAFPFPLPSQSSFTFAVTCYFLAGLSLDCCAPAVEVIRFPVLILSIAFSL